MGEIRTSRELTADLLYPLQLFYRRVQRPLPTFERVMGESVPEPFRQLLVHQHDMTPTLEAFHDSAIELNLIERYDDEEGYFRQVLLLREPDRAPVEYGAIRIGLAHFRPNVQKLIRQGVVPLGRILNDHAVAHRSMPKGYFKVEADHGIAAALGIEPLNQALFGRRNVLLNHADQVLADVVEILPPVR